MFTGLVPLKRTIQFSCTVRNLNTYRTKMHDLAQETKLLLITEQSGEGLHCTSCHLDRRFILTLIAEQENKTV